MKVVRHQESGFSLAELLIAMFVLVVGISGVTSAIYWGMQKSDSGNYQTQASNFCRVLTESYVARGLTVTQLNGNPWPDNNSGINDLPTVRRPLFEAPFTDLGDAATGYVTSFSAEQLATFTRNIRVVRIAPANATPTTGAPDYGSKYRSNMAKLIVTVYWKEKGHERSTTLESLIAHNVD